MTKDFDAGEEVFLPDDFDDRGCGFVFLAGRLELQLEHGAGRNFFVQEQGKAALADVLGVALPLHRDQDLVLDLFYGVIPGGAAFLSG